MLTNDDSELWGTGVVGMDNIMIFNSSFSQTEVDNLFNSGKGLELNDSVVLADTTPPTITIIDPTPANNSFVTTNFISINTTITDSENAISSATVNFNGTNSSIH